MTDSTDRIVWPQTLPLTAPIDGGKYYVKVSDTVTTWYSRFLLRVECGSIVPYPSDTLDVWSVTDIAVDVY
jgi:hypothetical protein